ncbi:MAG TPA: 2-C-methyl-D-erythritol 4-phosphate cytidylyltransferase, partial [Deltaproteobacteria bacterium]|nr:2-C-methyl-D-erythritol 4-phosphate cytidylyltransferase [Deltaproteobacteria bacterium]
VQTPQVFRRDIIMKAYERAMRDGRYGTDDATLVERIGVPVAMVDGSRDNIKITFEEDLMTAEALLAARSGTAKED